MFVTNGGLKGQMSSPPLPLVYIDTKSLMKKKKSKSFIGGTFHRYVHLFTSVHSINMIKTGNKSSVSCHDFVSDMSIGIKCIPVSVILQNIEYILK